MLNLAQTLMFTDFRGIFQFADVESRLYIMIEYNQTILYCNDLNIIVSSSSDDIMYNHYKEHINEQKYYKNTRKI